MGRVAHCHYRCKDEIEDEVQILFIYFLYILLEGGLRGNLRG